MQLICPKCQGSMRNYERNGVHVDQCQECRGIFLDRGELERLVDAENAWHGGSREAAPTHGTGSSGEGLGAVVSEVLQQSRGQKHGSSYDQPRSHGYQPRKKKKSFLDELFD